jgi:hypothetical protein
LTTPNEDLKNALRAENGRPQHESAPVAHQMPALGAFLNAALVNAGRTRAQLATQVDMDPLLVDGILDGLLPDPELDDATLVDLARALDLEPNLLRSILGRRRYHEARK